MSVTRRVDVARLWDDYGLRLMRYGGVTVVSTIIGVSTLVVGLYVFEWPPLFANFVSVCASTPPAYFLNRQWVWEQDSGGHSVAKEVAPFWIMTLVGFVVSMTAIGIVSNFTDNGLIFLVTQVGSFGMLWLVKFAFLEKYLWHDADHPVREAERV